MRHGLEFVDLHNPQVRRPPVRLEQWIVIGPEMSGYALPMNGGVQHPVRKLDPSSYAASRS
jgi:hypothetical protein